MKENDFFESFSYEAEAAWGDKSFNDACFVIEKSPEKDKDGNILTAYRHLPHHNKNATDPNANNTVDLSHLRNALARVNQVSPVKENATSFRKRAMAHLQRHAKALLKIYKKNAKAIQELCDDFGVRED